MKRLIIPFDVQKDGILDSLPNEKMIELIKEQMNYGWNFVNLKRLRNAAYDYRITVEWQGNSEPTVPPFSENR